MRFKQLHKGIKFWFADGIQARRIKAWRKVGHNKYTDADQYPNGPANTIGNINAQVYTY